MNITLKGGPLKLCLDVSKLFLMQIAITCSETNAEAHANARLLDDVLLRLTPKDKADAALIARAVIRYCEQ